MIAEAVTGAEFTHPGRPAPQRETTSDRDEIARFFGGLK